MITSAPCFDLQIMLGENTLYTEPKPPCPSLFADEKLSVAATTVLKSKKRTSVFSPPVLFGESSNPVEPAETSLRDVAVCPRTRLPDLNGIVTNVGC